MVFKDSKNGCEPFLQISHQMWLQISPNPRSHQNSKIPARHFTELPLLVSKVSVPYLYMLLHKSRRYIFLIIHTHISGGSTSKYLNSQVLPAPITTLTPARCFKPVYTSPDRELSPQLGARYVVWSPWELFSGARFSVLCGRFRVSRWVLCGLLEK